MFTGPWHFYSHYDKLCFRLLGKMFTGPWDFYCNYGKYFLYFTVIMINIFCWEGCFQDRDIFTVINIIEFFCWKKIVFRYQKVPRNTRMSSWDCCTTFWRNPAYLRRWVPCKSCAFSFRLPLQWERKREREWKKKVWRGSWDWELTRFFILNIKRPLQIGEIFVSCNSLTLWMGWQL